MNTQLKMQRGFTLIETIMVLMIVGIIGFVITPVMSSSFSVIQSQEDRVDLQENANIALARMTREIRNIKQATDILTWTATTFRFTETSPNFIEYTISGNTLTRAYGTGTPTPRVLANGVQANSLAFSYLKADGSAAANVSEIRVIQIVVNFQSGTTTIPIQVQIRPRPLNCPNGFCR